MRLSRVSTLLLLAVLVLVVAGTFLSRSCRPDLRRAIAVEENRVVVTNVSNLAWSDIDVWLNTWYRAQAPALQPGQRLEIPLRVFTAGPGQNFDLRAGAPVGIEVNARAADGSPVRVTWGEGRRR